MILRVMPYRTVEMAEHDLDTALYLLRRVEGVLGMAVVSMSAAHDSLTDEGLHTYPILRRMWDEVKNFNCDCHEEETSA